MQIVVNSRHSVLVELFSQSKLFTSIFKKKQSYLHHVAYNVRAEKVQKKKVNTACLPEATTLKPEVYD
jgi:hypothetical protein